MLLKMFWTKKLMNFTWRYKVSFEKKLRDSSRLTLLSFKSISSCQINLWIQHSFNKVSKGYFVLVGGGCFQYGNELNDFEIFLDEEIDEDRT